MSSQASPPFDKATADIVLCSSDDVFFRVHKLFLAEASPFFATMFTLPQPTADASSHDGLPMVPVPEDSKTLDDLLRICYPVPDPTLDKIVRVRDVLSAATKYEMEVAKAVCRRALQSPSLLKEPLNVYAVAVQFGLWEEALAAAKQTLREPMNISASDAPPPALDRISAVAFYRLLQYRSACKAAAKAAFMEYRGGWPPAGRVWDEELREDEFYYRCDVCGPSHPSVFVLASEEYDQRVREVLEATPHGTAILEDVLLGTTAFVRDIDEPSQCRSCLVSIVNVLKMHDRYLAEYIESYIAEHVPNSILGFEDLYARKRKRADVEE
ncbi:hypothetical protein B0H21DRAFT_520626 [Amylocystis lapponica]|nr:hypothetical protein B0H21DRAFT_520626 [Amylocystis lapponica]